MIKILNLKVGTTQIESVLDTDLTVKSQIEGWTRVKDKLLTYAKNNVQFNLPIRDTLVDVTNIHEAKTKLRRDDVKKYYIGVADSEEKEDNILLLDLELQEGITMFYFKTDAKVKLVRSNYKKMKKGDDTSLTLILDEGIKKLITLRICDSIRKKFFEVTIDKEYNVITTDIDKPYEPRKQMIVRSTNSLKSRSESPTRKIVYVAPSKPLVATWLPNLEKVSGNVYIQLHDTSKENINEYVEKNRGNIVVFHPEIKDVFPEAFNKAGIKCLKIESLTQTKEELKAFLSK